MSETGELISNFLSNQAYQNIHAMCANKLNEFPGINVDQKKTYFKNCINKSYSLSEKYSLTTNDNQNI
jgi:hypothetical protein